MNKNYEDALKVLTRFKKATAEMKEISQELSAAASRLSPAELPKFQGLMSEMLQSVS